MNFDTWEERITHLQSLDGTLVEELGATVPEWAAATPERRDDIWRLCAEKGIPEPVQDELRREVERALKVKTNRKPSVNGSAGDDELPTIIISNRQLSDLMRETMAAIGEYSKRADPLLFVRNGRLVRVAADEDGALRTDLVSPDSLMGIMAKAAHWITLVRGEDGRARSANVSPKSIVARVLCAEAGWDLPVLEGITYAPLFDAAGKLHTAMGYDAGIRRYRAGAVDLGDTTPSPENLAAAVALLTDDLFVDFPLDDASRAHAIALAILPFVRLMIPGATPMHLATAAQARSGKSLLVESALYPALGCAPEMTPDPGDPAEWGKVLTSKLLAAPPSVVFDNLSAEVRSPMLATAITEARLTSRILGSNTEISAPARWVWAATANNPTLHEELMLRSVLIRLAPNTEKPEERTGFKHPVQLAWVAANRDRLVTALITIVRNWIENAGMAPYTARTKGRFESWVGVMGGILTAAGIPGFLDNESELRSSAAPEADAFRAFVLAWWDKHGAGEVTAKDLFALASTPDDATAPKGVDLLGEVLGDKKEAGRRITFGRLLARYAGRVYSIGDGIPAGIPATSPAVRVTLLGEKTSEKVKKWALVDISRGNSRDSRDPSTSGSAAATAGIAGISPVAVNSGLQINTATRHEKRGESENSRNSRESRESPLAVESEELPPHLAAWLDDAEEQDEQDARPDDGA